MEIDHNALIECHNREAACLEQHLEKTSHGLRASIRNSQVLSSAQKKAVADEVEKSVSQERSDYTNSFIKTFQILKSDRTEYEKREKFRNDYLYNRYKRTM